METTIILIVAFMGMIMGLLNILAIKSVAERVTSNGNEVRDKLDDIESDCISNRDEIDLINSAVSEAFDLIENDIDEIIERLNKLEAPKPKRKAPVKKTKTNTTKK